MCSQIFSISENENTVGVKFDLVVQVECLPGTTREEFQPPRFEFSNSTSISYNADEGWHPEKVDESFKYVEQFHPGSGETRAYYRLDGEFVGMFLADMELQAFPFDVSSSVRTSGLHITDNFLFIRSKTDTTVSNQTDWG